MLRQVLPPAKFTWAQLVAEQGRGQDSVTQKTCSSLAVSAACRTLPHGNESHRFPVARLTAPLGLRGPAPRGAPTPHCPLALQVDVSPQALPLVQLPAAQPRWRLRADSSAPSFPGPSQWLSRPRSHLRADILAGQQPSAPTSPTVLPTNRPRFTHELRGAQVGPPACSGCSARASFQPGSGARLLWKPLWQPPSPRPEVHAVH